MAHFSDFWDNAYTFIDGRSPLERGIARRLNKRGMRDVRALMDALLGAAAGGAALSQYKRVVHPSTPVSVGGLGGLKAIETVDIVNRVTVAGDDTTITAKVLNYSSQPTSYPANGDGNPRNLAGG